MIIAITLDSKSREAIVVTSKIKEFTDKAIREAFRRIGTDLTAETNKQMLKRPKHGRLYRIRLRGRMINHRASSPDESPAVITNKLRKSVGYLLNGANQMSFGAGDQSDVNYALALEQGNPKRNLKGRHYLERSLKARQGNMRRNFEQQIQEKFK